MFTTTPKSKKGMTKMFMFIIQAVALYAQQDLATRGHREVESEDNEDSRDDTFQALSKSFARINPILEDHLHTWNKKEPNEILENPK